MNYLPRPNTSAEIKIFSEMFSGHFRRCWTRINIARRFRTPIQIYPDAERSSIGKRHHRGNHVQHRRSGHQSKDVQPGQSAKQRRLRTSFVPRAHDDEWRGWRFWRHCDAYSNAGDAVDDWSDDSNSTFLASDKVIFGFRHCIDGPRLSIIIMLSIDEWIGVIKSFLCRTLCNQWLYIVNKRLLYFTYI